MRLQGAFSRHSDAWDLISCPVLTHVYAVSSAWCSASVPSAPDLHLSPDLRMRVVETDRAEKVWELQTATGRVLNLGALLDDTSVLWCEWGTGFVVMCTSSRLLLMQQPLWRTEVLCGDPDDEDTTDDCEIWTAQWHWPRLFLLSNSGAAMVVAFDASLRRVMVRRSARRPGVPTQGLSHPRNRQLHFYVTRLLGAALVELWWLGSLVRTLVLPVEGCSDVEREHWWPSGRGVMFLLGGQQWTVKF